MQTQSVIVALFGPIGMPEMIVIAALGLLIFGRKLPEVGRSLGKSIVEFKRGLSEVKNEVEEASKDLPAVNDVVPGASQKDASSVPADHKTESSASSS